MLCNGVFDLLHIGHIRHLNQARQHGDVLLVTVTADAAVQKGPGRPVFNAQLRAEVVASLGGVDYVAVNPDPSVEPVLRLVRPHVYACGPEENNGGNGERSAKAHAVLLDEIGCTAVTTGEIMFSSTGLINRFFLNFPEELQQYLSVFRGRCSAEEIVAALRRMKALRVLMIGDAIIDDYHYCHTLGTSSKDPVLVVHYESSDMFAGGVLAAANHAANFAGQVSLSTVIGSRERHEDFIRSALNPAIKPRFFTQDGAPTLVKRRYVEGYSFNKLFEVYHMDDRGLSPERDQQLCDWLTDQLPAHDIVIVTDFGHGALSDRARRLLETGAPFLAVNTQANAGNRGFHTIARYRRADFVSIAEHELRLETRQGRSRLRPDVIRVAERLNCRLFAVTRGKRGCVIRHADGTYVEVPAFALKVVDRIGAGDAFFTVTALAARLGLAPEIIGFIGNVVGALAVEIIGNARAVDSESVENFIDSLLK